ncbi:MAG TPA: ABC transporter substrate-binding protein [Stellaceae bacterium]|nr:ABC transporter substrate-binding protein [Stellaceae bacterium]
MILDRWAEDRLTDLPGLAAELIASHVDLVVAAGTPATLAARDADPTLPIVMVGVEYPAALRGDGSDHPGGNLTGLSLDSPELIGQRLRILQQLVPRLDRIAVILRDEPGVEAAIDGVRADARRIGLKVAEFTITSGQTIERTFLWMRNNNCRAAYFASGPLGSAKQAEVIELATAARVAVVYPLRAFVAHGGLVAVAADKKELFRRAAGFVDKLLNDARAADLPIAQPTTFELAINLSAAKAIGLTIPQPLLARADAVIDGSGGT